MITVAIVRGRQNQAAGEQTHLKADVEVRKWAKGFERL